MNREEWLTTLAKSVEVLFREYSLEKYKLTCGWPSRFATGLKMRRVGECHSKVLSKSGIFEIFISPTIDTPLEVAGIVCHELAHIAAGIKEGHGPKFQKVCKFLGLTKGKPTQVMPGKFLNERLTKEVAKLGPYPHQALQIAIKEVAQSDPSFTLICTCGCKCRMNLEWLTKAGFPTCGCGKLFDLKK